MTAESLRRRREAWEFFREWESSLPAEERSFTDLVAWLGNALALARAAGDLVEEPIERKAERLARDRRKLSVLREAP